MGGVVLMPGDMSDIFWISGFLKVSSCTWDDFNAFVPWNGNDPARWSGKVQQLGGIFAGHPVPVVLGDDRLEVFGLGADYALYQKSYNAQADAMGNRWSPAREIDPLSRSSRIGVFGDCADQQSLYRPAVAELARQRRLARSARTGQRALAGPPDP
jgi:hypothetical protein